jgi:hypothetical protein
VTLYLFAIVRQRPRAPLGSGIARRPLSAVLAGGARVIVEPAPAPVPTSTTIRGHDRVVRRIARTASAVLPFRFGSVVADRAALRSLLDPLEEAIARALAEVDGCVQMTMRVYGERARAPRAPSLGKGPGARWLAARLAASRAPEIDPIVSETAPFVRRLRVERHDRGPLIASVYVLVPRAAVRGFRAALARGARELSRVRVETTGPWPAYAFAELP